MRDPNQKILSLDELKGKIQELKGSGKRVIWTNGCFDILHIGHVSYLQGARELGDILVVGINSDSSVRVLKGEGRPIIPEGQRARVLAAFECVDYVTVFSDIRVNRILEVLKPDVFVKGGYYTIDTIDKGERAVIEGYGGEIVILPAVKGESTTAIVKKILESNRYVSS